MQTLRTILWVLLTVVLMAFIAINWTHVPVSIWPAGDSFLQVEWPVGLIVLISYLIGAIPMWLYHRAARWGLNRRISTLENAVRAASAVLPVAPVAPAPPLATSTQLETGNPETPSA